MTNCCSDCAEFQPSCPGALCPYRPDPPREIRDLSTRILADAGWTRLVVCAAVRADRALTRGASESHAVARSALRTALSTTLPRSTEEPL